MSNKRDRSLPRFECRLNKPDGLEPGVWTLIVQQEINRQVTEHLYLTGVEAIELAEANEARGVKMGRDIEALKQFRWKATFIGGILLAGLEIALRYIIK